MKRCSKCRRLKPVEAFSPYPWNDGLRPDCKECKNAQQRRRHRVLGRTELNARKRGITALDYERLLLKQGDVCAICKKFNRGKRAMPIDHDHATGRVRGLLCETCNGGLGMFFDDPDLLRAAADYLESAIAWQEGHEEPSP